VVGTTAIDTTNFPSNQHQPWQTARTIFGSEAHWDIQHQYETGELEKPYSIHQQGIPQNAQYSVDYPLTLKLAYIAHPENDPTQQQQQEYRLLLLTMVDGVAQGTGASVFHERKNLGGSYCWCYMIKIPPSTPMYIKAAVWHACDNPTHPLSKLKGWVSTNGKLTRQTGTPYRTWGTTTPASRLKQDYTIKANAKLENSPYPSSTPLNLQMLAVTRMTLRGYHTQLLSTGKTAQEAANDPILIATEIITIAAAGGTWELTMANPAAAQALVAAGTVTFFAPAHPNQPGPTLTLSFQSQSSTFTHLHGVGITLSSPAFLNSNLLNTLITTATASYTTLNEKILLLNPGDYHPLILNLNSKVPTPLTPNTTTTTLLNNMYTPSGISLSSLTPTELAATFASRFPTQIIMGTGDYRTEYLMLITALGATIPGTSPPTYISQGITAGGPYITVAPRCTAMPLLTPLSPSHPLRNDNRFIFRLAHAMWKETTLAEVKDMDHDAVMTENMCAGVEWILAPPPTVHHHPSPGTQAQIFLQQRAARVKAEAAATAAAALGAQQQQQQAAATAAAALAAQQQQQQAAATAAAATAAAATAAAATAAAALAAQQQQQQAAATAAAALAAQQQHQQGAAAATATAALALQQQQKEQHPLALEKKQQEQHPLTPTCKMQRDKTQQQQQQRVEIQATAKQPKPPRP
jgi:hypothetical protein